jgi:hypothetical protein
VQRNRDSEGEKQREKGGEGRREREIEREM